VPVAAAVGPLHALEATITHWSSRRPFFVPWGTNMSLPATPGSREGQHWKDSLNFI
jgi:hypothetical protein